MGNNIYIVSDVESGEASARCGLGAEEMAAAAAGLKVRSILITHGHRDHHEQSATSRPRSVYRWRSASTTRRC